MNRETLLLYAVTDRAWVGQKTLYEQIEDALCGGVTLVQLREKQLQYDALVAQTREIAALCHRYGVPLIVNDSVDAALAGGADGVHVGITDTPVAEIRKRVGADFIIGATAKTVAQAVTAQAAGADYLGVGAVFPSLTKQAAIRITGQQLRAICRSVDIPKVAIGGIDAGNIGTLSGCGIDGVAVVSAIFGAADIRQAAAELKELAQSVIGSGMKGV